VGGQTYIPDWCLSVRGLPPYPPIPTLAKHHPERMMDVSPIAYVEDVESPTAFFLSGKRQEVKPKGHDHSPADTSTRGHPFTKRLKRASEKRKRRE
jgi:hypothetical protein